MRPILCFFAYSSVKPINHLSFFFFTLVSNAFSESCKPSLYSYISHAFQFHALSGKNVCHYELVCESDANLQNKESVSQCLHILSSLRLIMQVALPQERLCWIIFNGENQDVCLPILSSRQLFK